MIEQQIDETENHNSHVRIKFSVSTSLVCCQLKFLILASECKWVPYKRFQHACTSTTFKAIMFMDVQLNDLSLSQRDYQIIMEKVGEVDIIEGLEESPSASASANSSSRQVQQAVMDNAQTFILFFFNCLLIPVVFPFPLSHTRIRLSDTLSFFFFPALPSLF